VAKCIQSEVAHQCISTVDQIPAGRQGPEQRELASIERRARQQQMLLDRQLGKEARDLKGARHPSRCAAVRRQCRDVVAEKENATARRGDLSADQIEERRLPCAVRTDDRLALARVHAKAHSIDGFQPAKFA
jgi:hypothetical protein